MGTRDVVLSKRDRDEDRLIRSHIGFIQECRVVFKFDEFSHLIS